MCAHCRYPNALYFLDQLQQPEFRTAIANPTYKEFVHTQQYYTWLHYRNNRLKDRSGGGGGEGGEQKQKEEQGGGGCM